MTWKRNPLTACFAWTTVCLVLSAAKVSAAPSATDAEATRTDFSGRWVPDFERWQGVERLLDLQDAPWVVRQATGRVRAVEAVTQTDEEDSIYHPFDRDGKRHMEYVRERG